MQCAEALQADALVLPEGALTLLQAYLSAVYEMRGTARARGPDKRSARTPGARPMVQSARRVSQLFPPSHGTPFILRDNIQVNPVIMFGLEVWQIFKCLVFFLPGLRTLKSQWYPLHHGFYYRA